MSISFSSSSFLLSPFYTISFFLPPYVGQNMYRGCECFIFIFIPFFSLIFLFLSFSFSFLFLFLFVPIFFYLFIYFPLQNFNRNFQICTGDEGAPLFILDNNKPTLYGMIPRQYFSEGKSDECKQALFLKPTTAVSLASLKEEIYYLANYLYGIDLEGEMDQFMGDNISQDEIHND